MSYKVIMIYPDGNEEEDDEIFDSKSEAREYGEYLRSCSCTGREVLHLSNPGDYPYEDDDDDDIDFRIERC